MFSKTVRQYILGQCSPWLSVNYWTVRFSETMFTRIVSLYVDSVLHDCQNILGQCSPWLSVYSGTMFTLTVSISWDNVCNDCQYILSQPLQGLLVHLLIVFTMTVRIFSINTPISVGTMSSLTVSIFAMTVSLFWDNIHQDPYFGTMLFLTANIFRVGMIFILFWYISLHDCQYILRQNQPRQSEYKIMQIILFRPDFPRTSVEKCGCLNR